MSAMEKKFLNCNGIESYKSKKGNERFNYSKSYNADTVLSASNCVQKKFIAHL